jgi:hypothetical protein
MEKYMRSEDSLLYTPVIMGSVERVGSHAGLNSEHIQASGLMAMRHHFRHSFSMVGSTSRETRI